MKNSQKFTGRVYFFKNGETLKKVGYIDVDSYNLSDYDNVVKIELFINGVKTDAVYSK